MVAGGPGGRANLERVKARPFLLLLLAAATITGCGSTTTVVTDHTAPDAAPPGATAARTAPPPTAAVSTTTTPATSSAALAGRCTAATLALAFLGQQGATGHGELGFALRNDGARPCHTFGFPGVLFLTGDGAALPTASQRTTRDFFGVAPATGLDLAPGQTASFRLGVEHGLASSAGCTTAAALQVIPPDDTHALRVAIPGGAYECGGATVSPLQPGTSAFS